MLPALFVSHEIYRRTGYGGNHPLAIARVGPVMDLCEALGWLDAASYRESPRAGDEQLLWFHSADYLRALKEASASGARPFPRRKTASKSSEASAPPRRENVTRKGPSSADS
jgi:acetoin utilization deacetylase AcuC-like enzyme